MCSVIYDGNTGRSSPWWYYCLGKGEQKILVHSKDEEKWVSCKVKNVKEFTDHLCRKTSTNTEVWGLPEWERRKWHMRKVRHSKATERGQRGLKQSLSFHTVVVYLCASTHTKPLPLRQQCSKFRVLVGSYKLAYCYLIIYYLTAKQKCTEKT